MTDIAVAIADTNALYRLLVPKAGGHEKHRQALSRIGHLVVSPMVLAELDYLLTQRAGAKAAITALDFIARQSEGHRFEVPDVSLHLRSAMSVMDGYRDADKGAGVGLTDAMNVVLAAAYRTVDVFTSDAHFRMMRPLTGDNAFRLVPDDL